MGSGGHIYIADIGEQPWALGWALIIAVVTMAVLMVAVGRAPKPRWAEFSPADERNWSPERKRRPWMAHSLWYLWALGIPSAVITLLMVLLWPTKFVKPGSSSDHGPYQRMPTVLVSLIIVCLGLTAAWNFAMLFVDRPAGMSRAKDKTPGDEVLKKANIPPYPASTSDVEESISQKVDVTAFRAAFTYYFYNNSFRWFLLAYACVLAATAITAWGCLMTVTGHGQSGPYVVAAVFLTIFMVITIVATVYTGGALSVGPTSPRQISFTPTHV